MTRPAATPPPPRGADAAGWFVRIDAGAAASDEALLAAWLAERPVNERALERVELAAALGRRLAADPSSPLHAEAAAAARVAPRHGVLARRLAWGALAAAVLVVLLVVPDPLPPESGETARLAEDLVRVGEPTSPIAVLPTGVVVDASAVAVLPFAATGDGVLAAGLERDLVAALRGVPGLYVIAGSAVEPYAGTDLAAAEIGAMLGARGLVEAGLEVAGGRVRVSARLRETATGATVWQAEIDKPVGELAAVRVELADGIATAMFDSTLRARVAPARDSSDAVASGKPVITPLAGE